MGSIAFINGRAQRRPVGKTILQSNYMLGIVQGYANTQNLGVCLVRKTRQAVPQRLTSLYIARPMSLEQVLGLFLQMLQMGGLW
jgi:hypothetical protein